MIPLFLPCKEPAHGMELLFLARFLHFVSIMINFFFFLVLVLCREQSSILSRWVSIYKLWLLSCFFLDSIRLFYY